MEMTADVYFAQKLADNSEVIRNKAIRRLRKWIRFRSSSVQPFTEDEITKLWKGLFYCMWMSDKPLVQEDLASTLSQLIFCFENETAAFLYIEIFFTTLAREWAGIDRLRLDKFLMLMRKFYHACYEFIESADWEDSFIERFVAIVKKVATNSQETNSSVPLGLQIHSADIYVEELSRVGCEKLSKQMANLFLEPYCSLLVETSEDVLMTRVTERIFQFVMRLADLDPPEDEETEQSLTELDPSQDEEETEPSLTEPDSSQDEEETEPSLLEPESPSIEPEVKDNVKKTKKKSKKKSKKKAVGYKRLVETKVGEAMDVPLLQFDYGMLADHLFELASRKRVRRRNRAEAYNLCRQFRSLEKGKFPLDKIKCRFRGERLLSKDYIEATQRLLEDYETHAEETTSWMKSRRKTSKKRKRSDVEEEEQESEAADSPVKKMPKIFGSGDEKPNRFHKKGNMQPNRFHKKGNTTPTRFNKKGHANANRFNKKGSAKSHGFNKGSAKSHGFNKGSAKSQGFNKGSAKSSGFNKGSAKSSGFNKKGNSKPNGFNNKGKPFRKPAAGKKSAQSRPSRKK